MVTLHTGREGIWNPFSLVMTVEIMSSTFLYFIKKLLLVLIIIIVRH